jgi:hypothetical protein
LLGKEGINSRPEGKEWEVVVAEVLLKFSYITLELVGTDEIIESSLNDMC